MTGFGNIEQSKHKKKKSPREGLKGSIKSTSEIPLFGEAFNYHQQGNIKKAEQIYLKIISMKILNGETFCNLALIRKNEGKTSEALELYKKAIEIQPANPMTHMNLGWLYENLGDYRSALDSTKKSLEIKPDNILALINAASICINLGYINQAIGYSRTAVELNPDNPVAHNNLATCHEIDNNLRTAFNHYVESANQVQKQKSWSSLSSLISACLILFQVGKIQNSLEYLLIAKKIASTEDLGMDSIPIKTKNADINFLNYLNELHKNLEAEKLLTSENAINKVLHIGDSHCLSFANQVITIKNKLMLITPSLIRGAKAFHFKNSTEINRFKYAFERRVASGLEEYRYVFISFGEIDCRINEGIILYCQKYGEDVESVAVKTANDLVDYLAVQLNNFRHKVIIFGTPAPRSTKTHEKSFSDAEKDRILIIKAFNSSLCEACNRADIAFADVYGLTSNEVFSNNNRWMIDEFHLKKSALKPLLNDLNRL